jgi:hypothetical protein
MKFKCCFKDDNIPKGFTGMYKSLHDYAINFVQDGVFHNEFGPAVIYPDGWLGYYYNNSYCGNENDFTIKTWKKFVHRLKLEIFK